MEHLMDPPQAVSLFLYLACRSTLGNRSLSSESYTPDFTAVALNSAPFRMLRISRSAYRAALEATQLSPVVGYQVTQSDMHYCMNGKLCSTGFCRALKGCAYAAESPRKCSGLEECTSL